MSVLEGWASARFLELIPELWQFSVSGPFLPSRTPTGDNASLWAIDGLSIPAIQQEPI
jgi:hypothetical protein